MRRSYRRDALPRVARSRSARRSRRSRSRPTSSSASRARPRRTSPTRSRSSSAPRFDSAYTFQYSPRPGTRAATMRRPGARRRSCRSGSTGSSRCRQRSPRERNRAQVGTDGRGAGGGGREARRLDPVPDARGTGSSICASALPAGTFVDARDHRRGGAPPARPRSSPAPGRPRRCDAAARAGRPDRQRQDRGGHRARAPRSDAEIVSVDSMLVYRGMDVGTAKPTAEQRAGVPHHLLDLAEPSERFTVARFQTRGARLLETVARPLLVGGRACTSGRWSTTCEFPPEDPAVRAASLEAEADDAGRRRAVRAAGRQPTRSPPRGSSRGTSRRTIRALEVSAITGAPFSDFAAAWEVL